MELYIVTFISLVTIALTIIIYALKISNLKNSKSENIGNLEKEIILTSERLKQALTQIENFQIELHKSRKIIEQLTFDKTQLLVENQHLGEKIESRAKEFERLQKQATTEFENIANRILKQNTEDFSEINQKKINELIVPLKEKILSFEKKVEDTYEKGLKDQTDIKVELKKLHELNNRISTEANNLTKALKGDVKQQGNWGEIILERILERSGLTNGQEFQREVSAQNAEGKSIRPDVIINLPDKKHIIIDSKVSLLAYERFVNSNESDNKELFIKDHLNSLKKHIKELYEKHYSSSPQFNSPDFVLLFLPIESSFSLAIEQDNQIFNYAWDHNIVIVSPSTLLATLRTIASIWQQENQTKNAIEIAKQSGSLYDKFVGFLEDLEKIGKNINTLQKTYDDASKKLYTGSGNLVRRVELIKELGASTSKKIPERFSE